MLTPLEIAEALAWSMPNLIQQPGGDPIPLSEVGVDFDPEVEAVTDAPTRFWIRTTDGELFSLLVYVGDDPAGDTQGAANAANGDA